MKDLVGVLTTDMALVVTSWDDVLAAMTGIAGVSAVGRALMELVPDLAERGVLARIQEVLTSGVTEVLAPALHAYLIPCPPTHASNRFDRMRQRVAIGPLTRDGAPVGVIITIEDVTERVEREAAARSSSRPPADLGPLLSGLAAADWRERRSTVQALAGSADRSLVSRVVAAIGEHHQDFAILSSALQILESSGVDVASALVDLLSHREPAVRIQAALALGQQTASAATVAALMRALDDEDANVRFHAIEGLGRQGAAAAVERLAAIAESGDFFLAFAALDALGRIQDPSIGARLVHLLGEPTIAGQAAETLAVLGDEDAIEPLARLLDTSAPPVVSVVDAISSIHARCDAAFGLGGAIEDLVRQSLTPAGAQRLIDAVPGTSGGDLRKLVTVLGWLRGPAIERALTRLLGAPELGGELIEAIVRFGPSIVDRLVEHLGHDDPDVRGGAIVALGRIGDPRATGPLLALLGSDRDLLPHLLTAMARLGSREAFEPLLALLGDPDVAIRHAAIGALNSIGHPDMPARMQELLSSPDERVRESATRIAGYFGYAACTDALLERCLDPDETVRAAALEHLPYLDDPRVLPLLASAVRADSPRARAAAAHALGQIGSRDALDLLRAATGDADSWVRYFSVKAIARTADRDMLPVIERLTRIEQPPYVRIAAIDAAGQIGGPDAIALVEPAAADPDVEVAGAALRALARASAGALVGHVRESLAGDDPRLRSAAASALAVAPTAESLDLLVWTAGSDPDPSVVRAAAEGLRAIALSSTGLRDAAVEALTNLATDDARRVAALDQLRRLTPDAIPALGRRLSSRDPGIRRVAVHALARASRPDATDYVVQALGDPDPVVRRDAVEALARVGTRGVARTLADMAQNDADDSVRRAARAALRRVPGCAAAIAEPLPDTPGDAPGQGDDHER